MSKISITFFFILCFSTGFAQDNNPRQITLDESIKLALGNNLDLKTSVYTQQRSKVNLRQSKADMLPDINANYNIGTNTGRSIDPFTNGYINQELTFSNAGLAVDAVIFNGFQLLNRVRQNKLNLQASQMEVEEAKQNLILNVTLAYLQALNNRDLVKLAENRMATTSEQVTRLQTLYNEEVGNPADFSDIQGQFALDKTNLLEARNNYESSLLDLKRLMNIDAEISLSNTGDISGMEKYGFSLKDIFETAIENLYTFKARKLRVEAAEKGVKVARSQNWPEVAFFAQINTTYSSAAEGFTETGDVIADSGNFVTIDGQNYPVFSNVTQFDAHGISYEDQFNNNLNSVVGLSVTVPLFNGFRARNSVATEKINLEETSTALENTELQFKNAIDQAYNDMETAFAKQQILIEQVTAYKESFRVNEIRFNEGVSTIVEYTISKNNLDNAETNLSNAKYEYLLRRKVLDYYRGVQ